MDDAAADHAETEALVIREEVCEAIDHYQNAIEMLTVGFVETLSDIMREDDRVAIFMTAVRVSLDGMVLRGMAILTEDSATDQEAIEFFTDAMKDSVIHAVAALKENVDASASKGGH